MLGYYKDETELRQFKKSDASDAFNKIFKTSGKYYFDIPPCKPRIINLGDHILYKGFKFLIGPIHESSIKFV